MKRHTVYMDHANDLKETAEFIADYATCLLGSGVHTSRVIRNSSRIGEALGVRIHMTTLSKTIVLTVFDNRNGEVHTEVTSIPSLPISFEYNSELSALSWKEYDRRMPLSQLKREYEAILARPRMPDYGILLLAGLANASFCRLFGGAWGAAAVVFAATVLGLFTRQQLQRRHCNHFIVFMVAAFVASMTASVTLHTGWTPDIAIGTSVLFLIPGVPLINGIIDIIEGHTIIGISRLIQATLLVICIATGLSVPLLLFTHNLLW